MVLAQRQKYRSIEQDRKLRNKFMHVWVPYLTKETRIYNGVKTASSINCAGKTGQLHVKNEIRTLPNIIHKDKLKMD